MPKYMALDLGSKTIGIATSQGIIVTPDKTVYFTRENYLEGVLKLKKEIEDIKPEVLVVGYPYNMDGTTGPRIEMVELIINLILEHTNIKEDQIKRVDERMTTRMANDIMTELGISKDKRKQKKDTMAAVLILETHLEEEKKQHGKAPVN